MQRVFDFLRTDDIPMMARPSYVRELGYYMLWMLVLGAIEGNIAAIIAKKTFGASDRLTTIVWQAPIFMMILNIFWGLVIRGRRRLPLLVLLTVCATLLIGSIAFASPEWNPWGGWMFAAQIGLTHLFVTGLLTLQASIWQVNYPSSHRGRIIGRLQTIRFLFTPLFGILVAAQFNLDPDHYRLVYPAVAVLGLLSLIPLRRYRVRREKREIREYHLHAARRHGRNQTGHARFRTGLKEAATILRRDRAFRRYMVAQFTLGSANFFTDPVLLAVITGVVALDYVSSNLIMFVIPNVCSWIAIGFWAPYFDRVGVLRFRARNCAVWVGAYGCIATSLWIIGSTGNTLPWLAIPVLLAGRVLKGAAHAGGAIAWSLGHLHFARPRQVDLYMSIHVALTGMRALIMPHLGLLANQRFGNGSFGIAVAMSLAAYLLFRRLAREDGPTLNAGAGAGHERQAPAAEANIN